MAVNYRVVRRIGRRTQPLTHPSAAPDAPSRPVVRGAAAHPVRERDADLPVRRPTQSRSGDTSGDTTATTTAATPAPTATETTTKYSDDVEWLLRHPLDLGVDPALKALQDLESASLAVARSRRPRVLMLVGAAAVAVLLVADALALVRGTHHGGHPTHPKAHAVVVPGSAQAHAAVSWGAHQLPRSARVLTDPSLQVALAGAGFSHVVLTGPASPGGARTQAPLSFDYLISTPALRAAAPSRAALRRALASSVPIAVFGSAADQVVVRQVSAGGSPSPSSRARTDATRRDFDRQLLANPAIHAAGAARAALRDGDLDLRAATVLALMANSSHVDIISVNVDEPEQAAGLPARSIDVRTDAPAAVQAMLSNLPPSYQPATDTQLPSGAERVSWPIDPDPPTGLN